jgi:hypothetical protein
MLKDLEELAVLGGGTQGAADPFEEGIGEEGFADGCLGAVVGILVD